MGLRRAVAPAEDEALDAVVAGSVPDQPRHRASYAVAESWLVDPAGTSAERWASIRTALTAQEAGEIALLLTKWTRNKVRVALGLDLDEVVRQELT